MNTRLTVGALLSRGIRRLGVSSPAADDDASPILDTELLLAHALGASRTQVMTDPDDTPDPARIERFEELIERRATGEPMAYILGHKEFWSLRLTVSPSVLVPRPETELLVERALSLHLSPSASVVDLGTGSGAIALALASERPQWRITATDASPDALGIARDNAERLRLSRVRFVQGNWLEPLAGRRFELVVSNPPYVGASDPAMQTPALLHEPRMALSPGQDAFACLRQIIGSAPAHLEDNGWLLLEHGSNQAEEVGRELVARGFSHVRSHRDLAGHERMTEAQWS